MEEVSVIGIDLAKRSFQMHGAKADGSVVFRREAEPREGAEHSLLAAAVHGGDGGVRWCPLLGPGDRGTRPFEAPRSPESARGRSERGHKTKLSFTPL